MDRVGQLNNDMLPFAKLLGMRFVAAELDSVTAELVVRDDLCTKPAVMHGGAIMAFADTVGAVGTILNLPAGARTTTIESKTNFLAAAPVGSRLLAEAMPLHRGKTVMVWQTRISTDAGRLVALVTQTQLVLRQ
jgi:1,4-dihydroxy-2-naphthoyl-CoA hydrolase